MRIVGLVALVHAGALAAGCLGGPEEGAGIAAADATGPGLLPDGTRAPTSFVLDDCEGFLGSFPMTMGSFRAEAPEGFDPVPFPLDPTGQTATVRVSSHRCTFQGAESRDTLVNIPVVPPADLALEGAIAHTLVIAAFVSNPDVQAILAAWGLGEVWWPGDVGLAPASTAITRSVLATATTAEIGIQLEVNAAGVVATFPEQIIRTFSTRESILVGMHDVAVAPLQLMENGEATFRTTEGTTLPDVGEGGLGLAAWDYSYTFHHVPFP